MLRRFYSHAKSAIGLHNLRRDSALADAMVEQLEQRLEDTLEALSIARTEATTLRHKLQRAELRVSTPEARPAGGGVQAAQAERRAAAMPGAQRRRAIGQDSPGEFWYDYDRRKNNHREHVLTMVERRTHRAHCIDEESGHDR